MIQEGLVGHFVTSMRMGQLCFRNASLEGIFHVRMSSSSVVT